MFAGRTVRTALIILILATTIPVGLALAQSRSAAATAPVTTAITYGVTSAIVGSDYHVVFQKVAGHDYYRVVLHEGKAYGHSGPQVLDPQLPPQAFKGLVKLAASEQIWHQPKFMNCPPPAGTGVGASASYVTLRGAGVTTVKVSDAKGSSPCISSHEQDFYQFVQVLVAIANFPVSPRNTPK